MMYSYVDFIVEFILNTFLKSSLYYQTHIMNFHFWRRLLFFFFGKNLIAFNNPL